MRWFLSRVRIQTRVGQSGFSICNCKGFWESYFSFSSLFLFSFLLSSFFLIYWIWCTVVLKSSLIIKNYLVSDATHNALDQGCRSPQVLCVTPELLHTLPHTGPGAAALTLATAPIRANGHSRHSRAHRSPAAAPRLLRSQGTTPLHTRGGSGPQRSRWFQVFQHSDSPALCHSSPVGQHSPPCRTSLPDRNLTTRERPASGNP